MKPFRFDELASRLGERDWEIITTVRSFKYLTTRQISRQHFGLSTDEGLIPRHANHALARLRELGLLTNLERRIGGVRAGSGGHVWQITDLARRLLGDHLNESDNGRIRVFEPSTTFLEHTLAVAEVVISLQEVANGAEIKLAHLQVEPECWRSYLGPSGETRWLKPDLAVVTESGGFEDHWFMEVDRATEPPNRVIKKCRQYEEYRRSDREQAKHGVFPAVVWVVPNVRRRDQIRERLASEVANADWLFTVVTPSDLGALVVAGSTDFNNSGTSRPEGTK
ncbi:MAG: hypothetical protein HIU84_04415 [Acidobacteria bacterium]|nr:hypothetical protein [Acidobacteriota bacterium]